ncbi:type III secretion effector protein [Pseudomonas aylmerensis]|uniref:Type III secretion effector protein n=2 Tax=Pseudomonas aylmerensis TaxID=1869229 RepID=A0A2T4G2D5_9PSED|nr:type III secretion effector protein [Pseudomonas aylmerensis]PTC29787.1 type III secretion effector protein [Pseudomonas aylmerensis]
MSVSMLDKPTPASSGPELSQAKSSPHAKARGPAPAAPTFMGQSAASVSFQSRESHAGPVFGAPQSATATTTSAADSSRHGGAVATSSALGQIKHWMGQWFGGHRPPLHPGWGNPPPRPHPGWSNPPPRPMPVISNPPPRPFPTVPGGPGLDYSLMSRNELAAQLSAKYSAFRDPRNPGYVSVDSIRAMANKGWSPNPAVNENIRLAKALLRDPGLMSALDRHGSTGALDGLIDRTSLNAVINGTNYFQFKTDKELFGEMLEHYNQLKGRFGRDLTVSDLRKLAGQSLTGDSPKDHLIQLAQEMFKRTNALNLASSGNRITQAMLRYLSR